jgi:chromate reductase, NAD(P)H dehydrogenase (quinone)
MKVLGVAGSLRRDSHNLTLLRAAGFLLPPEVQFTEYEGLKLLPPFDEDDESAPALAVAHWRDAIAQADAILFATPEYNSSIPGQLKNAVDWASRPVNEAVLRNKPVAVIGASTSAYGALWAQAELRKVLAAAGARIVDRELPVGSAHDAFEDHATLKDRDVVLELDGILVELLYSVQQRRVA